ncbi:MAG: hypothetical protein R2911_17315 [Caldilineaceae bacterium]
MALQSLQTERDIQLNSDAILKRLDAIMRELHSLRQAILAAQQEPTDAFVDRLWGSLGQGRPDELNVYQQDVYLDLFDTNDQTD